MTWREIWAVDFRSRFDPAFLESTDQRGGVDRDLLACLLGVCL